MLILTRHVKTRLKQRRVKMNQIISAFNSGEVWQAIGSDEDVYHCVKGDLQIPFKMRNNKIVVLTVYKRDHPNHRKNQKSKYKKL